MHINASAKHVLLMDTEFDDHLVNHRKTTS